MGTSRAYSAYASKPNPSSQTKGRGPVRSGSVSVQTCERKLFRPWGTPSLKGEFAKSAVATGCSASATRIFFTMSASLSKSRLTWIVHVRNIMSRPSWPLDFMYSRMIP
jgi:hypothetical protein